MFLNEGATDLQFNRPTAAKKQLENHVQVGHKWNIEDRYAQVEKYTTQLNLNSMRRKKDKGPEKIIDL